MTDEIEWRDPPPNPRGGRGGPSLWCSRLLPLMDRPGCWAMVRRCPTTDAASAAAGSLRAGRLRRPPGKWEFASSTVEVFARYVGPE